jgi:hypothetical protein
MPSESGLAHPAAHGFARDVEVGSDRGLAQVTAAGDPDNVTLKLRRNCLNSETSSLRDKIPQNECQLKSQQSLAARHWYGDEAPLGPRSPSGQHPHG